MDPFAIAESKSPPILIVERDLPSGTYGACGLLKGQFAIAISKSCPTEGHRRFTAGHELGHYHIDGHMDHLFDGTDRWVPSKGAHFQGGASPVEREADYFASELLMPEQLVRQLVRGRPGLSQVKRVADECVVSLSSAAVTVARLAREPLAVFLSKDGILEWPAFSKDLLEYPWAHLRIKGEWAPPLSCTKRLGKDRARVERAERVESDGLLCEWFPGAPEWVAVTEEAIGLGRYGRILTVLLPGRLPDPDQEQERSWRRQRENCREDRDREFGE